MANQEELIIGDLGTAERVSWLDSLRPHGVMKLAGEFKDIVLGAFNGAAEHPVGTFEIGAAGVVTGIAAALALPRR